MGFQLPGWLKAILQGGYEPQADEDKLYALADQYDACAKYLCGKLPADIEAAANAFAASYHGEAGVALSEWLRRYARDPKMQGPAGLGEAAKQAAEFLRTMGDTIVRTKRELWVIGIVSLATILMGAGPLIRAIGSAAARRVLFEMLKRLIRREAAALRTRMVGEMAATAARQAGKLGLVKTFLPPLLGEIADEVIPHTLAGLAGRLTGQDRRLVVDENGRLVTTHDWDWRATAMTATGAVVAFPLAHGVGLGLNKLPGAGSWLGKRAGIFVNNATASTLAGSITGWMYGEGWHTPTLQEAAIAGGHGVARNSTDSTTHGPLELAGHWIGEQLVSALPDSPPPEPPGPPSPPGPDGGDGQLQSPPASVPAPAPSFSSSPAQSAASSTSTTIARTASAAERESSERREPSRPTEPAEPAEAQQDVTDGGNEQQVAAVQGFVAESLGLDPAGVQLGPIGGDSTGMSGATVFGVRDAAGELVAVAKVHSNLDELAAEQAAASVASEERTNRLAMPAVLGAGTAQIGQTQVGVLVTTVAPGTAVVDLKRAVGRAATSEERDAALAALREAVTAVGEAMGELHQLRRSAVPADQPRLGGPALTHGDAHIHNWFYDAETGRVTAIDVGGIHRSMDAEGNPIGSPASDVDKFRRSLLKRVGGFRPDQAVRDALDQAFQDGYHRAFADRAVAAVTENDPVLLEGIRPLLESPGFLAMTPEQQVAEANSWQDYRSLFGRAVELGARIEGSPPIPESLDLPSHSWADAQDLGDLGPLPERLSSGGRRGQVAAIDEHSGAYAIRRPDGTEWVVKLVPDSDRRRGQLAAELEGLCAAARTGYGPTPYGLVLATVEGKPYIGLAMAPVRGEIVPAFPARSRGAVGFHTVLQVYEYLRRLHEIGYHSYGELQGLVDHDNGNFRPIDLADVVPIVDDPEYRRIALADYGFGQLESIEVREQLLDAAIENARVRQAAEVGRPKARVDPAALQRVADQVQRLRRLGRDVTIITERRPGNRQWLRYDVRRPDGTPTNESNEGLLPKPPVPDLRNSPVWTPWIEREQGQSRAEHQELVRHRYGVAGRRWSGDNLARRRPSGRVDTTLSEVHGELNDLNLRAASELPGLLGVPAGPDGLVLGWRLFTDGGLLQLLPQDVNWLQPGLAEGLAELVALWTERIQRGYHVQVGSELDAAGALRLRITVVDPAADLEVVETGELRTAADRTTLNDHGSTPTDAHERREALRWRFEAEGERTWGRNTFDRRADRVIATIRELHEALPGKVAVRARALAKALGLPLGLGGPFVGWRLHPLGGIHNLLPSGVEVDTRSGELTAFLWKLEALVRDGHELRIESVRKADGERTQVVLTATAALQIETGEPLASIGVTLDANPLPPAAPTTQYLIPGEFSGSSTPPTRKRRTSRWFEDQRIGNPVDAYSDPRGDVVPRSGRMRADRPRSRRRSAALFKRLRVALRDERVRNAAEVEVDVLAVRGRTIEAVVRSQAAGRQPFRLVMRVGHVPEQHPMRIRMEREQRSVHVTVSHRLSTRANGLLVRSALVYALAAAGTYDWNGSVREDSLGVARDPREVIGLSSRDSGRVAMVRFLAGRRRRLPSNLLDLVLRQLGALGDQELAQWTLAELETNDRALITSLTKGKAAGDVRKPTVYYVVKRPLRAGLTTVLPAVVVGALAGNPAAAVAMAVPLLAHYTTQAWSERRFDAGRPASGRTRNDPGTAYRGRLARLLPSGLPEEPQDKSYSPASLWEYGKKWAWPGLAGLGATFAVFGFSAPPLFVLYGGMMTVYPVLDRWAQSRQGRWRAERDSELIASEVLRADRFENALAVHLLELARRFEAATGLLTELADLTEDPAAGSGSAKRDLSELTDLGPLLRGYVKSSQHAIAGLGGQLGGFLGEFVVQGQLSKIDDRITEFDVHELLRQSDSALARNTAEVLHQIEALVFNVELAAGRASDVERPVVPPPAPAGSRPEPAVRAGRFWVYGLAPMAVASGAAAGIWFGLSPILGPVLVSALATTTAQFLVLPAMKWYDKFSDRRTTDGSRRSLGAHAMDRDRYVENRATAEYIAGRLRHLLALRGHPPAGGGPRVPAAGRGLRPGDLLAGGVRTDQIRAAVREAQPEVRSDVLEEIERLANAVDDLAARSDPKSPDWARALYRAKLGLAAAIARYESLLPAFHSVDPSRGTRVSEGFHGRLELEIGRALDRLHGDPNQPGLFARVVLLHRLREAIRVEQRARTFAAETGNHEPLRLAFQELSEQIEAYNQKAAELDLPERLSTRPDPLHARNFTELSWAPGHHEGEYASLVTAKLASATAGRYRPLSAEDVQARARAGRRLVDIAADLVYELELRQARWWMTRDTARARALRAKVDFHRAITAEYADPRASVAPDLPGRISASDG